MTPVGSIIRCVRQQRLWLIKWNSSELDPSFANHRRLKTKRTRILLGRGDQERTFSRKDERISDTGCPRKSIQREAEHRFHERLALSALIHGGSFDRDWQRGEDCTKIDEQSTGCKTINNSSTSNFVRVDVLFPADSKLTNDGRGESTRWYFKYSALLQSTLSTTR